MKEYSADAGKGAVLYDFLLVKGGAEAVTIDLSASLKNCALCVEYINEEFLDDLSQRQIDFRTLGKHTTVLGWQTIKGIYNFKCKTGFLKNYDWVIYSGSNAPVAVHNQKKGRKYLYCHTIPRFAYDLKNYYLDRAVWWQIPLFILLVTVVRRSYEAALKNMDVILVNSANTRDRLLKYTGYDATVVYPPVHTDSYKWGGQGDYYLSTARIESFKRVRLIVEAFRKMPSKKLIVASGGSELDQLRALARDSPNITFTGWLTKERLAELVAGAIATIYMPMDEDFGMSPVESMAAGKPVIGVMEGGLLETVIPGETGILVSKNPTQENVMEAVEQMSPEFALSLRKNCEKQAEKFSVSSFLSNINGLLGIPLEKESA